MNKYFWLLIVIFTLGCSSSPKIETQQYLLVPSKQMSDADASIQKARAKKQLIIVEPIQLATYLDQPGIILMTDKHQIEVAHYHRWAEPLDQNIHRFMLEVLSVNSTDLSFQRNSKFSKQQSHFLLNIEFDQFNGTSTGKALVGGSWSMINSETNELVMSDSFHYDQAMSESGYVELVNQLAIVLENLSLEIMTAISEKL